MRGRGKGRRKETRACRGKEKRNGMRRRNGQKRKREKGVES